MRSQIWFRFAPAPQQGEYEKYEVLARAMRWLSRGEVPVDGCMCPEEQRPKDPTGEKASTAKRQAEEAAAFGPAPVRWGNFR